MTRIENSDVPELPFEDGKSWERKRPEYTSNTTHLEFTCMGSTKLFPCDVEGSRCFSLFKVILDISRRCVATFVS